MVRLKRKSIHVLALYCIVGQGVWLSAVFWSSSAYALKNGSCYLTGPDLNFGSVSSQGKSNYVNWQVSCHSSGNKQTVHVALCPFVTVGSLGLVNNRRLMVNHSVWPPSYLSYDLFYDPALTQRIDTKADISSLQCKYGTIAVKENKKTFNLPIYGLVYAAQNVNAGLFDNYGNTEIKLLYALSEGEVPTKEDVLAVSQAQPATNSFRVTSNFENSCNLISASDLNFGQINDFSKAVTSSTRVTLSCPRNTNWKVGLDQGLNYDGTTRRMRNGADYIGYELYQDASYRQPWNTTDASQGTGTNGTQIIQIYGKVPQSAVVVPPGEYQDTITITLTY
jgi:spore coat protein U-like protein